MVFSPSRALPAAPPPARGTFEDEDDDELPTDLEVSCLFGTGPQRAEPTPPRAPPLAPARDVDDDALDDDAAVLLGEAEGDPDSVVVFVNPAATAAALLLPPALLSPPPARPARAADEDDEEEVIEMEFGPPVG